MINITDKSKCCGCTACFNICPKQAIEMKADKEGFLYPVVNTDKCIECGLCEKVCPEINGYKKSATEAAYVVRNKSGDILSSSTSGGAFYAFASNTVKQGGSVYGALFAPDFEVVHRGVKDEAELKSFCGSKYVQSYLGDTFSQIKKKLDGNEQVLFSGTSCQIAGLKNYLSREYDNLLTVEVICHGAPSPLLWKTYLEYQKNKYKSVPKSISFRKKTYGYHSGTMEIIFENGKRYTGSARVDYMLKSFFSEISSRPVCYSCMCKGDERPADISIYDCWHADKLVDGLTDDDKGYTNILINTEKGQHTFDAVKGTLEYYSADRSHSIELDGIMVLKYPKMHKDRKEYYGSIEKSGLSSAVKKHITVRKKDLLIEKSKKILYKLGLFEKMKRFLK